MGNSGYSSSRSMREIAEREAWKRLGRNKSAPVSLTRIVPLDGDVQLALDKRCLVLAGFNGAGKSMTLDAISRSLSNESAIVRLHEICEQVRSVLRSRSDIEQMEAEVGPISIDRDTIQSLGRVIGRDYDAVEWYGLELEPTYEQCRLVKRVVGGPAGWFGGCIAVDGVRASWLENCDGYLFSRPGDRFWVGVCSAARGFPRCLAHVVCVALWGENTAGSVIRRRRMCSVRVKDNRSGSISTVSAASDMKARIA